MVIQKKFADRREAGRELAEALSSIELDDPIVVALPRGGVPVAFEVAEALGAPLDVFLARKLGAPEQPELALGAVSEDGQVILDGHAIAALGVSRESIDESIERERAELRRRRHVYRGNREPLDVFGRTVVMVDDGLATGSTAIAAARALKGRGAVRVIAAVPVGPQGVDQALAGEFDEFVCLLKPLRFGGVGLWYQDFAPTPDDEVVQLLASHHGPIEGGGAAALGVNRSGAVTEVPVSIPVGGTISLIGELRIPPEAGGVVVFAHGAGSSRHSPRNRKVAEILNESGFATLLMDLLSEEEETLRNKVFDVDLLAGRLVAATNWVAESERVADLPIGYFGASTGAAAALMGATRQPGKIAAVVSRGGRPDLAVDALGEVEAPTLLIVGGADPTVRQLNEAALQSLGGTSEIMVVPGAGHLFEERGALDRVAGLAVAWFTTHLGSSDRSGIKLGAA